MAHPVTLWLDERLIDAECFDFIFALNVIDYGNIFISDVIDYNFIIFFI